MLDQIDRYECERNQLEYFCSEIEEYSLLLHFLSRTRNLKHHCFYFRKWNTNFPHHVSTLVQIAVFSFLLKFR